MSGPKQTEPTNKALDWLARDEPLAEAESVEPVLGIGRALQSATETSDDPLAEPPTHDPANDQGANPVMITEPKTVRVMPPVHPNEINSKRSFANSLDQSRNRASDMTQAEGIPQGEGISQAEGMSMSGVSESDTGSLQEKIIAELREIYDPEIPVNIYDLGLIYGVDVNDDGHVDVTMTLTTPGCPVAQTFPGEIEARVGNVDGVESAAVELVWDPPWTIDMMPEDVKLQLGLL